MEGLGDDTGAESVLSSCTGLRFSSQHHITAPHHPLLQVQGLSRLSGLQVHQAHTQCTYTCASKPDRPRGPRVKLKSTGLKKKYKQGSNKMTPNDGLPYS